METPGQLFEALPEGPPAVKGPGGGGRAAVVRDPGQDGQPVVLGDLRPPITLSDPCEPGADGQPSVQGASYYCDK